MLLRGSEPSEQETDERERSLGLGNGIRKLRNAATVQTVGEVLAGAGQVAQEERGHARLQTGGGAELEPSRDGQAQVVDAFRERRERLLCVRQPSESPQRAHPQQGADHGAAIRGRRRAEAPVGLVEIVERPPRRRRSGRESEQLVGVELDHGTSLAITARRRKCSG